MSLQLRRMTFGSSGRIRPVWLALIVATGLMAPANTSARTWRIEPGGTGLRATIEQSASGDTILIAPGVYEERGITVDRPLTLRGIGGPEIDGQNGGEIFTITSSGVRIEGLVIRNVGTSYMEDRAGIKLVEVSDCWIRSNLLLNTFFGIYLENCGDVEITGNTILGEKSRETAAGNGIHLWYCRDITITENHIRGHRDGIYLEFVEDSRIRNNTSERNMRYGLHFMFSHNDVYTGNVFRKNGAGVAVMFSNNVAMRQNRFEHNWGSASYGLLLKDIRDSEIAFNVFERNTIGLYAEGSDRMEIRRNAFTENGYAIKIMANSMNNHITENNFIQNTFDVATNSRQNFNSYDGNYWSGYRGYDLDRDGVGDVPHRPVHLFSLLVEREPAGLILLRSFFIDLIDSAEKVLPLYTPETLLDRSPVTRPVPIEGDRS